MGFLREKVSGRKRTATTDTNVKPRKRQYDYYKGWNQNYLTGYNYCSPGSKMSGALPTSPLDRICMIHDLCYQSLITQGKNPYGSFNKCDRKMLNYIDQKSRYGTGWTGTDAFVAPFASAVIKAKKMFGKSNDPTTYSKNTKQLTLPQCGLIQQKRDVAPTPKSDGSMARTRYTRKSTRVLRRKPRKAIRKTRGYTKSRSRLTTRRSFRGRRRYSRRIGRSYYRAAPWMGKPWKFNQMYSFQVRSTIGYYGYKETAKLSAIEDLNNIATSVLSPANAYGGGLTTNEEEAKIMQVCHASINMLMTNGGAQPVHVTVYAFFPRRDMNTTMTPSVMYADAITREIQHGPSPDATVEAINTDTRYTFTDALPNLGRSYKFKKIFATIIDPGRTARLDFKKARNFYWNYSQWLQRTDIATSEYRFAKGKSVIFYFRTYGLPGHGTFKAPVVEPPSAGWDETALVNFHATVLDVVCKETYYARNIPSKDFQRHVILNASNNSLPAINNGLAHPDFTGHDMDVDATDKVS